MTDHLDSQPGTLDTDHITIRTLTEGDLGAVVAIDAAATGHKRQDFFRHRIARAMQDSSVHLSLVAELDEHVVGFVTVVLFYGEFGVAEPVAVLDSVGVHPEYQGQKVAKALLQQLSMNLRALRVRTLRTEVDWDQSALITFFNHYGFRPGTRLVLEKDLEE